MMDSGSPLRCSAVAIFCTIEWILTMLLFCTTVASYTGLIDIKYLYAVVLSFTYPQHRPVDTLEVSDKESLQLSLDMEIFLLLSITASLSMLLFWACRRKSPQLCKIWVSIQIVMTLVISFPLVLQYSSLTNWRSSAPFEYEKIIMLSWAVWICYRFLSILIVADELRRLSPQRMNPGKDFVQLL